MTPEKETTKNLLQGPSKRIQLFEVGVFLFLIMPSLVLSSFSLQQHSLTFSVFILSSILQNTALLCLVLFFIWRNQESMASIGWTRKHPWKEGLVGIALFFPLVVGVKLLESGLRKNGIPIPETPPDYLTPTSVDQFILAFVFLVVVAVSEEVIFRGYLIRRFINLSDRPVFSVVLAAAIFSLGHGYQGVGGIIEVGALGIVFGAIYVWRGSLWAPIVMHFLQNFIGIVVIPLQKGG